MGITSTNLPFSSFLNFFLFLPSLYSFHLTTKVFFLFCIFLAVFLMLISNIYAFICLLFNHKCYCLPFFLFRSWHNFIMVFGQFLLLSIVAIYNRLFLNICLRPFPPTRFLQKENNIS